METTNNEMTAERSLEIIRKTIEESRRNITRGSWKSFLLWGTSVAVIALIVGHLWQNTTMGPAASMLWCLLIFVALIDNKMLKQEEQQPQTFINKTLKQVWSSFGIMAGGLGITLSILSGFYFNFPVPPTGYDLRANLIYIPITATIILSMGIAGMITGRVLNNKPITVCCFIAGLTGSILATIYSGPLEMVILAMSSIIGLVVPALIIKSKEG